MRMFAAVFPPDEVWRGLVDAVQPAIDLRPDIAWSPPQLWHLSLTVFGNVTLQDVAVISQALDDVVANRTAPRVRVSGPGTYPESGAVTELFLGIESPDHKLVELRADVLSAASRSGWRLDRRAFRQHITLARCDPARDVSKVLDLLEGHVHQYWSIPSIALVWSRSADMTVPRYQLLSEHSFLDQ